MLRSLLVTLVLVAAPVLQAAPGAGRTATVVSVRRVRRAVPLVEVEVTSREPFPVGAQRAALRVGSREFRYSRRPPDGRLTTLIFQLTPAEWSSLKPGETVTVHYGEPASPGGPSAASAGSAKLSWSAGRLDKGRLR